MSHVDWDLLPQVVHVVSCSGLEALVWSHCRNPVQDSLALVQNREDLQKAWWSEPLRHAWPDKQDCARA